VIPFLSEESNEIFAIFSIQDVTDETNQIENYKNMRDVALFELSERTKVEESLRISEQRLKELNASKDKFFSIIAHDLRGPFSNLINYSEMILFDFDKISVGEFKDFVSSIYKTSKNTFTLLQNLLDWTRVQTGMMETKFENVDLLEAGLNIIHFFDASAKQKQISLKCEIPADTMVYADINMLNTVFRNLISNAIKFTPTKGRVKISALKEYHSVLVSITDTGIGIPQEDLSKLFRMDINYSRKGTNEETGTGLGLLLCQDLVKKHSSELKVESKEGLGSRFYFSLPIPQH
jgi:signal transduction histidine kinase